MNVKHKRNLLTVEIHNHEEQSRKLDLEVVRLQRLVSTKRLGIEQTQRQLLDQVELERRRLQNRLGVLKQEHTYWVKQLQKANAELRSVHKLQLQVLLQLQQLDIHEGMVRYTKKAQAIQQRVDQKLNQLREEQEKQQTTATRSHYQQETDEASRSHRTLFVLFPRRRRGGGGGGRRRLQRLTDEVTKLSMEADRLMNLAIGSQSEEERIRLKRLRLVSDQGSGGGGGGRSDEQILDDDDGDDFDGYSTELEDQEDDVDDHDD